MSLFAELKRRNVIKVAGAYLALAWVVVQATGAIVPALNLPASLVPIVVWIGVIGFPCVLIFAWVYELTPEGLKLESEVDRSQSITHVTSKRLDYIIIAMLAVAIGLFVLQYLRPPVARTAVEAPVTASTPAAESTAPVSPAVVPAPVQPATPAPDEKSIAVMPFLNMSSDKEQEYFSDGMSEELLNLLAQVQDLKVIARTSSFAFKGKDVPIAEIAKQLNVAHVLEGSVRKSGNQVRITAQLIRTADSTHLWSETYDRPLDDIFAVQDEIAGAIAQALQIKLAGGELSRRKGGTQNLEAYQLYLRAADSDRYTRSSVSAAAEYLEQAIKIDPNFGLAWSALADVVTDQTEYGYLQTAEGWERVRELAQHALQVSPDNADAHAALQGVYQTFDWNWTTAEHEGQRALAIDPMNLAALTLTGRLYITLGRHAEAEQLLRTAMTRDPLHEFAYYSLGLVYYLSGQFTQAEVVLSEFLAREPGNSWIRGLLAETLVHLGKSEAALDVVEQGANKNDLLWCLPVILQAAGRQGEAEDALKAQISFWADTGAFYVATSYAHRGDHALALDWIERAYEQRDPAFAEFLGEPLFKPIAHDARFLSILQKINLPTEPVPVNWQ